MCGLQLVLVLSRGPSLGIRLVPYFSQIEGYCRFLISKFPLSLIPNRISPSALLRNDIPECGILLDSYVVECLLGTVWGNQV